MKVSQCLEQVMIRLPYLLCLLLCPGCILDIMSLKKSSYGPSNLYFMHIKVILSHGEDF